MEGPSVDSNEDNDDGADSSDDDKDERKGVEWKFLTERTKDPTFYSYAWSSTGYPIDRPGPHTVADVAHRWFLEKLAAGRQWNELARFFNSIPTREAAIEIALEEVTQGRGDESAKLASEQARELLGVHFDKDYDDAYKSAERCVMDLDKKRDRSTDEDYKKTVIALKKLTNLHPYGTANWISGLAQGLVTKKPKPNHGASKAKGERIMVRQNGKLSASKSGPLIDFGVIKNFKHKEKAGSYTKEALTHHFESEKKANLYIRRFSKSQQPTKNRPKTKKTVGPNVENETANQGEESERVEGKPSEEASVGTKMLGFTRRKRKFANSPRNLELGVEAETAKQGAENAKKNEAEDAQNKKTKRFAKRRRRSQQLPIEESGASGGGNEKDEGA